MDQHFWITVLTRENEDKAQQLVLQGMKEHFGLIDHSLNPDLYPILKTYKQDGYLFLTGFIDGILICTGGIVKENQTEGRIVRMSTAKEHRGKGYAKAMLAELERRSQHLGYVRLVLETNKDWKNAIGLYQNCGYHEEFRDDERIHMYKDLC
ncbi:MAG TPA: GNAT family N-acetyltransferase [Bacillales bacterium]|nr:GNAT family N-acetyltransferase [Bacillales bacterium]